MSKFHGKNSRAARLTEAQVERMREEYASGQVTQGELGRRYGVSVVQVGRIVRNESWVRRAESLPPPRDADIAASVERALAVAREVSEQQGDAQGTSALAKMREQMKQRDADNLVDELKESTDGQAGPSKPSA